MLRALKSGQNSREETREYRTILLFISLLEKGPLSNSDKQETEEQRLRT